MLSELVGHLICTNNNKALHGGHDLHSVLNRTMQERDGHTNSLIIEWSPKPIDIAT